MIHFLILQDIDFARHRNILWVSNRRERSLVASRLRELLTALRRRGLVHRAIVIEARVPIIKGEFDLPNAGGNIGTRGLGSAPKYVAQKKT